MNIDDTIQNSVSSFGRIPYGHKIEGRLLFDLNNRLGCKSFDREAREDPLVGESPFIMVYQGSCSIIDKVKNIEKSGGHLAIIINDNDDNIGGIFVSDDGAGDDISIPAVLISSSDGKKLVEYYIPHSGSHEDIKEIKLEVKFENENKDNTVKYDIWYSPDQDNAYVFLNEFKHLQEALGDLAILGVHFFTYPHYDYRPERKQNILNCFGSGLYCSRPGKSGVKNGANVIRESIRQKCIYNYAYDKKDKKTQKILFWNYIENFYKDCVNLGKIDISCSESVLKKVGIPSNNIKKCYENSFIGDKIENYELYLPNTILNNEYDLRRKNFISKSPSITINDRVYLGGWKANNVFESLCYSLIKKPEACYIEPSFNQNIKGVTLGAFLSILLVVIFINILLFLACKTVIKKSIELNLESSNINNKIDTVVNSYLNLRDSAPNE